MRQLIVASILIIAAPALSRGVSPGDPFLEQGLHPAACIITDHNMDTFMEIFGALGRGGARALQAFPPDVIFGRFPEGIDRSMPGGLPVEFIGSPAELSSSDLGPVTRGVIRDLFNAREIMEGAEPFPRGPLNDLLIKEPPGVRAGRSGEMPPVDSPGEVHERGYRQNSEFMIGTVLINIIFPESEGWSEDWTDEEISGAVSGIALGIDQYQRILNWVDLDFVYNYSDYMRIPVSMEPIEVGNWKSTDSLWIGEVLENIGYAGTDYKWQGHDLNNETRAVFSTDWVFTAFIVDASNNYPECWLNAFYTAYAFFGGPFLVMPYPACGYGYETGFSGVFIHEMSHIFWALDEYEGGQPCSERSGYLAVRNRNAKTDSCQATVPCIMRADLSMEPLPVCDYTLAQIGLADENRDAVPDIYEVPPVIEFLDIPGVTRDTIFEDTYLIAARIGNEAVPNRNPYQLANFPEKMIDYAPPLVSGDYSINSSAIFDLEPADGNWDESSEDIAFFTTSMEPGLNRLTIRAQNCAGLRSEAENQIYYVGIEFYETLAQVEAMSIELGWKTSDEVFRAVFDVVREDLTEGRGEEVIATIDRYASSGGGRNYYRYTDGTITPMHDYRYRVVGRIEFEAADTTMHLEFPSNDIYRTAIVPGEFDLVSNLLPNPTADRTSFTVNIPKSYHDPAGAVRALPNGGSPAGPALVEIKTPVDIGVYNVLGQRIATIYSRSRFGGYKIFSWNGRNRSGQPVNQGVYFIRVNAGGGSAVRKVVIIR